MRQKLLCSLALLALHLTTSLAAEKLRLVVTLSDIGSIAQIIGGEAVQVDVLARGTEDPHFLDARPSFVRLLNKADVLIEGGAGLESGWLPPLVQNARNKKIVPGESGLIVANHGLPMLDVPAVLDRSQGDVHPSGNPHYMMNPELALRAAKNIADGLAAVDANHAGEYQTRFAEFSKKLEENEKRWKEQLKGCEGTKVITYHKSFDYVLKHFGLNLVNTIEPKPGIEPSPSHVTHLIQDTRKAGVKLTLAETFRPHKTGEKIAKEIGAAYVILPLTVGATDAAKDYFSWMDEIVSKLKAGCETKTHE